MRRFTNSELTTFKTCRRQWWLRYYRRLSPVYDGPQVSAASLGTLVHLGLETLYSGGDAMNAMAHRALSDGLELAKSGADEAQQKKFEKQSALAATMVSGYLEYLEESGADANYEFLAAEQSVEVEIGDGRSLLGKLDAKVRRRDTGEIRFMDHKTVQSIDGTVEAAYRSSQFRHYAMLEMALLAQEKLDSPQAGGVVINMLRKVGRGASSKPPYYGRHEFSFNEKVTENHWMQVLAEIGRIEQVTDALNAGVDHHIVVPPNPSRDCSWRCEFRQACPMFDDGSDVETVLAWNFRESDPLARYETEEKTESE